MAMGLPAASSIFRFSSRQYGLAFTSRQLAPTTSSRRSFKRMFLHSALLQNKFPNSEAGGHPESAAQTRPDDNGSHSNCPCCRQRKFINMDYDQGASRSPIMDATLTALMGMGIGEPQPWTMRLCRVYSLPYYMVGCLASGFRSLRVMLTPFLWASSLGQRPKHLVKLPNLQLVGRIRLRELVSASPYDAAAEPAPQNPCHFFFPPTLSFAWYLALIPDCPSLCRWGGVLFLV